MDFAVATIHANTSTPLKNVYVYIHEMDPENVRKTAPIVRIDWTTIPDRTQQAKNAIMTALSDKLAEITGDGDQYSYQRYPAGLRYAGRHLPRRQLRLVNI